jgi:hypothetical protein
MVILQPEMSAAEQERTNFSPVVIENIAVPIGMESFSHICIFINMRSVEAIKSMRISRKMRRHPIENNSDPFLVKNLNQMHQFFG